MSQMARGSRTDKRVRDAIWELGGLGERKAPEIQRLLEARPEFAGLVPELRTIQSHLRQMRPREPIQPWGLRESDPEDLPLILDLLADAIDLSEGRIRWLTVAEAEWVVRFRRAYPELELDRAYALARMAVAAESGQGFFDLAGIARYLAYRPWTDGAKRYVQAFVEGRIFEYYGIPPHDPPDQEVSEQRKRLAEALRRNRS